MAYLWSIGAHSAIACRDTGWPQHTHTTGLEPPAHQAVHRVHPQRGSGNDGTRAHRTSHRTPWSQETHRRTKKQTTASCSLISHNMTTSMYRRGRFSRVTQRVKHAVCLSLCRRSIWMKKEEDKHLQGSSRSTGHSWVTRRQTGVSCTLWDHSPKNMLTVSSL